MVLNIVNRLSRSFSFSNPSFDNKPTEQFCPESRNMRKLGLWNSLGNNKVSFAKINRLQRRNELEKADRFESNDSQPLLFSSNDSISKMSTKSSIKYSDSFEERSFESKLKKQLNEDFEKTSKKENFRETLENDEISLLNNSNNERIHSFNYKNYPISSIQIMNWMNSNWSELEIDEIDTKNCVMVEIDTVRYKEIKEIDNRIITPFHSLTSPKISIGEYFITRIVKFMSITPVDFCVIVILIRRAINNSGGVLKTTTLTSHRLVLAASLLTYKLMYDVQYGMKFWAHIGGVPQWEMVMLEHHLLKILNWDLNISFQEFIKVYHEIISSKNTAKNVFLNKEKNCIQVKSKTKKVSNTPQTNRSKNKSTVLKINVFNNNSYRKKC
ncbi:cyclin family [Cryptosporidium bovis]|uniref:cyclin family n=1 Tax=Cryptosporidium bovis TaxID=310047 RepID=UPI00351AA40B|nr:cyclin family [Cryptosporidium bovis]